MNRSQQCQHEYTLPTNFNQRPSEQRSNAIPEPPRQISTRGRASLAEMPRITRLAREGSSSYHGNVTWTAPFSTSLRKRSGVMRSDAIPHSSFPREGSVNKHRNVRRSAPFPTSYRGSVLDRRNAKDDSPPPVLGHPYHAERPRCLRPILTRGQSTFAAMPCI